MNYYFLNNEKRKKEGTLLEMRVKYGTSFRRVLFTRWHTVICRYSSANSPRSNLVQPTSAPRLLSALVNTPKHHNKRRHSSPLLLSPKHSTPKLESLSLLSLTLSRNLGRRPHSIFRLRNVYGCLLVLNPNLFSAERIHPVMGRKQRAVRGGAAASTHAGSEELDIRAFSRTLYPFGLCIRDVSNDGNCFFRAVSDQLYGSEDYHMKLRERACDYLMAHKEHYRFFVDDEQTFDDYVAEMRTDGVWADNLELQAISMACNVNIRVHQSGKPSYDIRNHTAKDANVIHLSYHFGEHYASVRPLQSSDMQIPAEHDPLPTLRLVESVSQNESQSARQEGATRRPRHRHSVEEDSVTAVWKRADKGHCDLCSLVDQTRRAARAIRFANLRSEEMAEKREMAERIERDMVNARSVLEDIGFAIITGKDAHRVRSKKLAEERLEKRISENPSESDGLSSYSEEDGDDEEQYRRSVRAKTDAIFSTLDETENAVLQALRKVTALKREPSNEVANPTPSTGKHTRGSKRKEQEIKRRERKERRRKEQERVAQSGEEIHVPQVSRTHELDIAI